MTYFRFCKLKRNANFHPMEGEHNMATLAGFQNLNQFIANPIHFLDSAFDEQRDFLFKFLGPQKFLIVTCPDIGREILLNKSGAFLQNRSVFKKIEPVTGVNGLVQLNGETSKNMRSLMRPLFDTVAMGRAESIILSNCQRVFKNFNNKQSIDPIQLMTDLALQNALEIFVGVSDPKKLHRISTIFLELQKICGRRMLSPLALPLFIPSPENIKVKKLRKTLRKELADHLLDLRDPPKGSLPNHLKNHPDLVDHCLTLLFAGHETSASSLAFTLLLLARHSKYQSASFIESEKGILALYKESLRVFPPAYMLVRQIVRDTRLSNGQKVFKGQHVIIALKQILNSDKFFTKADQYYPERFLDKRSEEIRSFYPFGLGAKSCIGEQIAYLEAKVVLSQFLNEFKILPRDEDITSTPMIVQHPNPGQFITIERKKYASS